MLVLSLFVIILKEPSKLLTCTKTVHCNLDVKKILSSSGVERSAVNRFVVGSNPTWGVRISYKGNTLAFQAKAAGSSPAIRFFIVN